MENVKDKFESFPGFPQQFRVQFEHQDCDIIDDLDEPAEVIDRSSNILNVIADEKRDDADKVDFESDFESDGTVSVVCAFLHCYT